MISRNARQIMLLFSTLFQTNELHSVNYSNLKVMNLWKEHSHMLYLLEFMNYSDRRRISQ